MPIRFEDDKPAQAAPDSVKEKGGKIRFEEPSAPAPSFTGAATDVINRALIAGTLGAPVDIAALAMRPFGYTAEPILGSEWIGKQMERAGMVSPVRRPVAETLAGIAPLGIYGATQLGKGVASLGKKAADYYRLSKGTEAESLSEALRTKMRGTAENVVQAAKEAQLAPEKRLAEIGKAQEQIGAREPIAAARQATREQSVQESLNQVSPQKGILAEDVGGQIQSIGQKNVEGLKSIRQEEAIKKVKDPAFEDARVRESQGDFISTNPQSSKSFDGVIGEIERQISRTPEPYASELKRRFAAIKGKEVPLNDGEIRAAQLRASILGKDPSTVATTRIEPMTMDQAEFLRRMLNNKDAFNVEGYQALDVVRQNKLADLLTSAMNAYEPRMGEYLSKYKTLSEPISRAVAGRAGKLTEVEIASAEQQALYSSDKSAAAKYFLDGSAERANRLLELVGGKNESINKAIKGYFRTQLEGMNSNQASKFLRDNEGLLRVFPEYRSSIENVVKNKKAAETLGVEAGKKAEAAATRLAGEAKVKEAVIKEPQKLVEKYQIFENQLSALTPKDSVATAKTMADSLRKDRQINDDVHRQILSQIETIKNKYGDSAQAKQQVQLLMRKVLIYGGLGTTGYIGYGALKSFGE